VAPLAKRSLQLSGHATSLALEPEFWAVLERMAAAEALSLPGLLGRIDGARGRSSLASACRVQALHWVARPFSAEVVAGSAQKMV
jgi:predicted DNA-binding ribbon-helix-helix protein